MAAKLNVLNGASDASIATVMANAQTFFTTRLPGTAWTKQKKAQLTGWAGTLGSYNEGTLRGGPPHCSEDNTVSSAE